jgi:hypothetical protein
MEKNKVAGSDGFLIEFFQSCWEIIKVDLMQMFSDFHQHKIPPEDKLWYYYLGTKK